MNDKIKVSVYLSPEYRKKLDKLYTDGIDIGSKMTYGDIVSNIIDIATAFYNTTPCNKCGSFRIEKK